PHTELRNRARVKMEQIKPGSTLPRGKKEGGLTVKLFKGHYTSFRASTRIRGSLNHSALPHDRPGSAVHGQGSGRLRTAQTRLSDRPISRMRIASRRSAKC
ncbi:MAG: hypothetical protein ACREYE_20150, partial [Gammaproteobacteria bacterium]